MDAVAVTVTVVGAMMLAVGLVRLIIIDPVAVAWTALTLGFFAAFLWAVQRVFNLN